MTRARSFSMQTDIDDVFTDAPSDETPPDHLVDQDEMEPEVDGGPESVARYLKPKRITWTREGN